MILLFVDQHLQALKPERPLQVTCHNNHLLTRMHHVQDSVCWKI